MSSTVTVIVIDTRRKRCLSCKVLLPLAEFQMRWRRGRYESGRNCFICRTERNDVNKGRVADTEAARAPRMLDVYFRHWLRKRRAAQGEARDAA